MFTLPNLPFDPTALEPHFDTATLQLHHSKHHAAYVKNLNDTLSSLPDLAAQSELSDLAAILADLDSLPTDLQTKVKNHGGGHWNHSFFWSILSPAAQSGQPSPQLETALTTSFGSLTAFKEKFSATALGRFGSGWAWLVKRQDQLEIIDTPNQDSPVTDHLHPLLCLDVWEHAYYLKYQNRRADYISAFWNVVNWPNVSELFTQP